MHVNYLMDLGVSDVFNSQYNIIYLLDDYHSFLKQQDVVFACIW